MKEAVLDKMWDINVKASILLLLQVSQFFIPTLHFLQIKVDTIHLLYQFLSRRLLPTYGRGHLWLLFLQLVVTIQNMDWECIVLQRLLSLVSQRYNVHLFFFSFLILLCKWSFQRHKTVSILLFNFSFPLSNFIKSAHGSVCLALCAYVGGCMHISHRQEWSSISCHNLLLWRKMNKLDKK